MTATRCLTDRATGYDPLRQNHQPTETKLNWSGTIERVGRLIGGECPSEKLILVLAVRHRNPPDSQLLDSETQFRSPLASRRPSENPIGAGPSARVLRIVVQGGQSKRFHVARRLHDQPIDRNRSKVGHAHVVNQVKEFLLRNHTRALTLGEIAWHVKSSEEHLARTFRKVTGQTVFDYLRTVRLENAKTLLIDSQKTLTEIASLTGFSTLALFSHNFTQYVGRNPSAYRKERAQLAHWEHGS